ncbi:hypothetical protein HDU87_002875 [Geranomyces variabilis]|uniref:Uncharacterized protein n=1 Tax=Geranomyces variabilis TaxID=109894 RepID=A0AAD5TL61_9FUNG|nr:hypothetical protein HDU87_002875 [Geranomyces variabilis]
MPCIEPCNLAADTKPKELLQHHEQQQEQCLPPPPPSPPPTGLSRFWSGYFAKPSAPGEASLAWRIGESGWNRLENASWRIWNRKAPEVPPPLPVEIDPPASESTPPTPDKSAPATPNPVPPPPTDPKRRPTLFETYIPQLPTAVLERLKKESMTDTISTLLGENLAELISTAISRAEASGFIDPASPAYARWRRQSSPTAFMRKWGWLPGTGGGMSHADSAVDLDVEELLDRIGADNFGDSASSLFSLQSTPPVVAPNTPTTGTSATGAQPIPCSAATFRKRSIQATPPPRASLLSLMLDQSLPHQQEERRKAAIRRRRMLWYMRRQEMEEEGEDKRGMDVETYMKLTDACDSAAVSARAARVPGVPRRDPFGDPDTRRRQVTDTAQSLIDPTWRIRDARSRRVAPWPEQRRAATYDASSEDPDFSVW